MRPVSLFRAIVLVLVTSVVFGGATSAQSLTPPPDGITVIGMGQASTTPDSSLIQISLGSEMYGQPMMPQPQATPGAMERAAVQPVVDALVNAGIAETDIAVVVPPFLGNVFSGPYGPISALIEVTLIDPDAESITDVINAGTIGAGEARMYPASFNIVHRVDDCSALKQEARQAAFDDASSLAAVEADIVGVSLGNVVAVRDSLTVPTLSTDPSVGYAADGSCSSSGMSGNLGFSAYGPPPFNLSEEPAVIVYAATEVTFSIDSTATPAS